MKASRKMPHPSEVYPDTPKGVCRICKKRCPKNRWAFCSNDCQWVYTRAGHWSTMRRFIGKRDKYVCQLCGLDCRAAKRTHFAVVQEERDLTWERTAREQAGSIDVTRDWWTVDHIRPICEWTRKDGPNAHAESNLRVLCWPCHKGETRKLAKRRSK